MNKQPLIEEARVKFTGLSSESFEMPDIGETRTFTVKATCTDQLRKDMKSEGERVSVTMKIDKVVEGVSQKINEDSAEPSLFDTPEGSDDTESDESDTDSGDPDTESEGEETDSGDSETPSNVKAFTGPQFSAGE